MTWSILITDAPAKAAVLALDISVHRPEDDPERRVAIQ